MTAGSAESPSLHRACTYHPAREAVARCPDCGRPFCRECITEHDFRMICADCLAGLRAGRAERRGGRRDRLVGIPVLPFVQVGAGVIVAWAGFYLLGRVLLQIPTEFHEGTLSEELLRGLTD